MSEDQIFIYMNKVIDELHPNFKAISDEEMIDETVDYGDFTRTFKHDNGKKFQFQWRVYFGDPDTVRTVFSPSIEV